MKRKGLILLMILLASLAAVLPVLAAAPSFGVVHEGVSVPGIGLGSTRAEVEAAYGSPLFCQSVEAAGDFASCSFPVDGGGQVDVRYRGADGGNASNSPDDVVTVIRWHEQVSGWTTTAGVNTTLAKADPNAVIAAYPNAQVTYNSFGGIYSVNDSEQGIQVIWAPDFYRGTVHVSMAIFNPHPPTPLPEAQTRVNDIDLSLNRNKGQKEIRALVQVRNERELAAAGATVIATWTFPDGTTQTVQDDTSSSGYAYFELIGKLDRGNYTLTIDDVILNGHTFNRDGSVLSATINVK